MPEGHTLHRLARAQQRQFAGRPIAVTSPQGRFAADLVDGRVLDGVTAYGKHLFAAFGDRIVHVHLGLYGKFAVRDRRAAAESRGALRMRWVAESGWTDLRGPDGVRGRARRRRSMPSWPASVPTRCVPVRTVTAPSSGSAAAGPRWPVC